MSKSLSSLIALPLVLLASLADAQITAPSPHEINIQEAYQSIRDLEDRSFREAFTSRQRSQSIATAFDNLGLADIDISTVDDENLAHYFRITALAAAYAPFRSDILINLVNALDESQLRRAVSEEMIQRVFRALVNGRDLDTANALRDRYPRMDLPALPALINDPAMDRNAGSVAILRPDVKNRTLVREHKDMTSELVIIVIANHNCRWFSEAMTAVEQDQMLRKIFENHAMLLIPQTATPHPQRLFDLGAKVWIDLALMDQWTDWPAIDQTASPSFYVFSKGQLVGTFVGWGGDELLLWLLTTTSPANVESTAAP